MCVNHSISVMPLSSTTYVEEKILLFWLLKLTYYRQCHRNYILLVTPWAVDLSFSIDQQAIYPIFSFLPFPRETILATSLKNYRLSIFIASTSGSWLVFILTWIKHFFTLNNFLWLICWQIFDGFLRSLISIPRLPATDNDLCRFVCVNYFEDFWSLLRLYIGKGW